MNTIFLLERFALERQIQLRREADRWRALAHIRRGKKARQAANRRPCECDEPCLTDTASSVGINRESAAFTLPGGRRAQQAPAEPVGSSIAARRSATAHQA